MQDNIFRFVNLRPPQRKEPLEGTIDYVDPFGGERYDTDFRKILAKALESEGREGARTEADNHIANNGIVNDLVNLQTALAAFDRAVVALGPDAGVKTLSGLILKVFDGEPRDVIARDVFKTDRRNLADSITAGFFASSLPIPRVSHLVRGLRLCELIERIALDDEAVAIPDGVERALKASIVIPFDLPSNVDLVVPETRVALPLHAHFPVPTATGGVKPAGVSDLLIVRQTLRRYERGEIAHVENALKGESKERTHRRTQTTETLLFQETETTTEQERDLQSTERFELKSEASKTVKEDMRAQAGLTVTGSYGPVTATVTGQFAFERSVEEATRSASTYARDVVERSRSRIQEQTLERRSTRTVLEIEETTKHGLDNKKGKDHIVGVYRWLEKIYEAQIVNYGKRLMIEFYVPEPAAYHRVIEESHLLKGLTKEKPEKPVVPSPDGSLRDFRPEDVEWPAVQGIAAQYGAAGIQPPPEPVVVVGASIEIPHTDKDQEKFALVSEIGTADAIQGIIFPAYGGTKTSADIKIPKGYIAAHVKWSGNSLNYVRANPWEKRLSVYIPSITNVSVGSVTGGITGEIPVDGFTEDWPLPVAVITSNAALVVTFRVICRLTKESFEGWQVKTYDTIMAAYLDQLRQYEEEVSRLNVEGGIRISGRPSSENRKTEHTELKRAAISILTRQHFDGFDAFDNATPSDASKSPRIIFDKAALVGTVVQYFEQSFEWHNMTYLFYPYFWGEKSRWPKVLSQESTDPLFTQFLQAGYARVQVPVRPNYETMVLYFLETFKLWQEAEDAPVSKPYLPLVEEIRNQTGDDFTIGVGTIDIKKGRIQATGNKTQFTKDDVDREIRVQSKVYRIASFQSATAITLAKPFSGTDDANAAYSLGPKLVGPSWEVRLPTTLVMIDKPDVVLPSFPDN